jgi:hypothetical protein
MHRLRVILAGRNKDVEERYVTISFNQSPERAKATRGRVPLVYFKILLFLENGGSSTPVKGTPGPHSVDLVTVNRM